MSFASDTAADWRQEIERLKVSIPLWESGKMHASADGVDVTKEHIAQLRRTLANLEKGVRILESNNDA